MKHLTFFKMWTFLCTILLMAGCVKEDTDDCPDPTQGQVILEFAYTLNVPREDLFTEQVENVDIFIYNTQGQLAYTFRYDTPELINRNRARIWVDPGEYTVIVWGNLTDQYYNYMDDLDLQEMILEVITDDDLVSTRLPHLYHGSTTLTVPGGQTVEKLIYMVKDTNDITVVIEEVDAAGTYAAPGTDFMVRITGCNSKYNFDNSLHPEAFQCTYIPEYTILPNGISAEFTIMRMFTDDDLTLRVTEGDHEILNRSLTELVMLSGEISTNEDLDRHDQYRIHIPITRDANGVPVVTVIYIDGWELVLDNGAII